RTNHAKRNGQATATAHAPAGTNPPTPLESIVFRLVRTYVQRKTEERSGMKWQDFKDRKVKDDQTGRERIDIPAEYRDAREKVCSDAFLALRSRRQQDFVAFFTATLCQGAHFLPH